MMKAKIHFQAIRGFLIYLFVFLIYLLYLEIKQGSGKAHYGMCMGGAVKKILTALFVPFLSGHIFRRGIS